MKNAAAKKKVRESAYAPREAVNIYYTHPQ